MSDLLHYEKIDALDGYRIVQSPNASDLSTQVMELLNQGWSLLGSHQYNEFANNSYPVFSQTMVKVHGLSSRF